MDYLLPGLLPLLIIFYLGGLIFWAFFWFLGWASEAMHGHKEDPEFGLAYPGLRLLQTPIWPVVAVIELRRSRRRRLARAAARAAATYRSA